MPPKRVAPSANTYAAWILSGVALVLVLLLQLLPALLAGLLVYELVIVLAPSLFNRLSHTRAKVLAVFLLAALVVGAVAAGIAGAIAFFKSDVGSLSALLTKMAEIVASSRSTLPNWLVNQLPDGVDEIREALAKWFRVHAADVQSMGQEAARALLYTLIGMIVGALIALRKATNTEPRGPLAVELLERAANLATAFRRVVFAQVRISLINTLFTAVYLALILPLFGVELPLRKTLIAVTFVAGLLPVVGNLISNFVVVIVSSSVSSSIAFASLAFLIVIHKLEYFLNARIVGGRIGAHAWELLVAIIAMEAAFGIPGVIAAPIYYAFLKGELASRGLV